VGADLIAVAEEVEGFRIADFGLRIGRDREVVSDGAAGGGDEGGEDTEERGFARAVGPEEAEDFLWEDGEGEIVDSDAIAIGMGKVIDAEHGEGNGEGKGNA
jgi:hypothetical protein